MFRKFIFAIFLAIGFVGISDKAEAVLCGTGTGTCFVLAAGGNWNTSGTWSDTSGGASCACTPATGDAVLLDASSGNSTANANISVRALDANGYTGTLTHNTSVAITVTGNDAGSPNGVSMRFGSGMTYSPASNTTSTFTFTSTSGTTTITLNSSGASRNLRNTTVNGSGGSFVFGSTFNMNAGSTLTHTVGTLNFNDNNASIGLFDESGSTARTLTLGSGTVTLTGVTGNVLNITSSANLTVSATTGTIDINATPTSSRTVVLGTKTLGNLTLTGPSSSGLRCIITVNGSVTNLALNTRMVTLSAGVNLTVSGTLSTNAGTSTPTLLNTDGTGGSTMTFSGGAQTVSNLDIGNITAATNSLTANSSYDLGSLVNITVNNPAGGSTGGHVIGGGL